LTVGRVNIGGPEKQCRHGQDHHGTRFCTHKHQLTRYSGLFQVKKGWEFRFSINRLDKDFASEQASLSPGALQEETPAFRRQDRHRTTPPQWEAIFSTPATQ
jgi:hypothetical protein